VYRELLLAEKSIAQGTVGGYAACNNNGMHAEFLGSLDRLGEQHFHNSRLETCRQVADRKWLARAFKLAHHPQHCRLQSTERKIPCAVQPGAWEGKRLGVSAFRRLLDGWSTGIGQTQQPGDLIKSFTGCIIQGCAQPLVLDMSLHQV